MKAIGLMCLATIFYAVMDAAAKDLVSAYPVMQLLAMRAAIVMVIMLVVGTVLYGRGAFTTRHPGQHFVRMLTCIAAPYLFFMGLKTITLTEATVIFFASSFFMSALSRPMLGERVGLYGSGAILLGFLGVAIVLNPDLTGIRPGALYALGAAFFNALALILGRKMSDSESTFKLVFSANLGIFAGCSLAAPWIGGLVPFALGDSPQLLLLAVFGLLAHLLLTRAFALAPVGTVAPFEYLQVIWAALIGYAIFGESLNLNTVMGGGLVILAGLLVIYREKFELRLSRQRSQG